MTHTVEVVLGGVIAVNEFLNERKKQRRRPVGANMNVMHRAMSEKQTLNHLVDMRQRRLGLTQTYCDAFRRRLELELVTFDIQ